MACQLLGLYEIRETGRVTSSIRKWLSALVDLDTLPYEEDYPE